MALKTVMVMFTMMPEEVKVYRFELDDDSEEFKRILAAHNCIGNMWGSTKDEEWKAEWVNNFLDTPKGRAGKIWDFQSNISTGKEEWRMVDGKERRTLTRIEPKPPAITGNSHFLVVCGYMM